MRRQKNNKTVMEAGADDFFLPDFCATQPLLMLILAAQLLAVLLVLAGIERLTPFPWDRLILTTFLVQWITLVSAALLCKLRHRLQTLRSATAAGISFLIVVGIVALFSALAKPILHFARIDFFYQVTNEDVLRNTLIGAIIAGLILRYFYLQEQLRARQRTELTARLQALQSRIRPHFLFNSMNIIASLIHVDPDKAEQVVEDLSELFRASLKAEGEIDMEQELALCQHYINIEALRLGDRLHVEWRLNVAPEDLQIPALTLQPLIENAIYHGVEPRSEQSTVRITLDYDGKTVNIIIINPVAPAGARKTKGNQMAIDNIRQRLLAHYGEAALLSMYSDDVIHTTRVSYPLQQEQSLPNSPIKQEQAKGEPT